MATIGPEPRSFEKTMEDLSNLPLFMRSLPEGDVEDPVVAAMQALVHEGTPNERAKVSKENGNDYYKGRKFREALTYYSQGLDAKPTDPFIIQSLLLNRAACNIELKNYGYVLRDCSRIIATDATVEKAYYRSAVALVALERFVDAVDCCDRCLAINLNNDPVRALREKAINGEENRQRRSQELVAREQQQKLDAMRINSLLKERNVITVSRSPDESPHAVHFDDATQAMVFPVWFLYPQYGVSDMISEFSEDTTFGDHLDAMFGPDSPPPAFDPSRSDYKSSNLAVYTTTRRKRVLKCGRKTTLRELLASAKAKEGDPPDGMELKSGCLSFIVVPKGDHEKKWIDEFKQSRGW